MPKTVWPVRARLGLGDHLHDLALPIAATDSKLHDCGLVKLAVSDLVKLRIMRNVFEREEKTDSGKAKAIWRYVPHLADPTRT